jgi:hypothetical protein
MATSKPLLGHLTSRFDRSKSTAGLVGQNTVDVDGYDDEIHAYLIAHGAEEFRDISPLGAQNDRYSRLNFPGCKPVRFMNWYENSSARIFFPTQDDALLFSVVFGHKITRSHVKQIQNLLDETHG